MSRWAIAAWASRTWAFSELGGALIGARDTGEALDAVIADGPGWEGLGDVKQGTGATGRTARTRRRAWRRRDTDVIVVEPLQVDAHVVDALVHRGQPGRDRVVHAPDQRVHEAGERRAHRLTTVPMIHIVRAPPGATGHHPASGSSTGGRHDHEAH